MRFLFPVFAIFGLASVASVASAQNTSGVFGPVVNADDHGIQYRAAAIIDGSTDDFEWGQRFHYEKAVSGSLRLRGILATRETNNSETDFDFARIEAVLQVTPDDQDYQSGVRFEGRLRGDGRADEVRANWINQWSLGDGWRARAIMMNTYQVAQRTNDELQFAGRFGLSRKLPAGLRLGVHSFIDFGDTGGIRVLNGNNAEAGPFVSFDLTDSVDVYIGTLHGLTKSSDDNQLRLFVGKSF
jgi:hypothetical protein